MIKIKPRRIIAFIGVIVLAIGGYVGWQIYQGQQMADQYATDAQKSAQGSGNGSALPNTQVPGSNGTTPGAASGQTSPSQATQTPSSLDPQAPGSQPNSNASSSASGTPSSGEYKQLMSSPYQQTLDAMKSAKSSTLALQGKNMSLSAYKAGILQCQATFSAAEAYVRANPPSDATLNSSQQEFLAGISLAKQSMGVVLNGISSFSPSSLYAAREMGKKAQQQVVEGYAHL